MPRGDERDLEATRLLERAITIDPLSAPARFQQIDRAYTGRESAESLMREFLAVHPDYYPALQRLARYRWLFHHSPSQAIALIENAIAADPQNPLARQAAATFYLDIEDEAAAADAAAGTAISLATASAALELYAGNWRAAGLAAQREESFTFDVFEAHGTPEALRDMALHTSDYTTAESLLCTRYAMSLEVRSGSTCNFRTWVLLAHLQLLQGHAARAREILESVIAWIDADRVYGPVYNLRTRAQAEMLLGRRANALRDLTASIQVDYDYVQWWYTIERDPIWDEVRDSPEFRAIAADAKRFASEERAAVETLRNRGEIPATGTTQADMGDSDAVRKGPIGQRRSSDRDRMVATTCIADGARAGDEVWLETIVVTARKLVEDAGTLPLAMDVLGTDTPGAARIDSLQAISAQAPGFGMKVSSARRVPMLRGQSQPTAAATTSCSSTASTGNPAIDIEPFDLERIELIRGPQSTLFGHSAFCGALNYVIASANGGAVARALVEGGTDVGSACRATFRTEPAATWLGRLAGSHRQADGSLHDSSSGEGFGAFERRAIAGSLARNVDTTDDWGAVFGFRLGTSEAAHPAVSRLTGADYNCGSLSTTTEMWSYYCGEIPVVHHYDLSDDLPDSTSRHEQVSLRLSWPLGAMRLESDSSVYWGEARTSATPTQRIGQRSASRIGRSCPGPCGAGQRLAYVNDVIARRPMVSIAGSGCAAVTSVSGGCSARSGSDE
jgi:hypothetical protein